MKPKILALVEISKNFPDLQVKAIKSSNWSKSTTLDFFTYEDSTTIRTVKTYKEIFAGLDLDRFDYVLRIKSTTVPNLKNLPGDLTYAGAIELTDQRSFLVKSFSTDAYIIKSNLLKLILEDSEDSDTEEEFVALNLFLKAEKAYEFRKDLLHLSLLVDHVDKSIPTIHAINGETDKQRSQLISVFPSTKTLFVIHEGLDRSDDPKKFLNAIASTELLFKKNKNNEIRYRTNRDDDSYIRMVRVEKDLFIDENFTRQSIYHDESTFDLDVDLSGISRHVGKRWLNRISWYGMRTIDETGVLTNCDNKEESISLRAINSKEDSIYLLCEQARHLEKFIKSPKGNFIYVPGSLKTTNDENFPLVPVNSLNSRKVFFFWHNDGESFERKHWLPRSIVNSLCSFVRNNYSVILCSYQKFENLPAGVSSEDANETMEYSEWFDVNTNYCKLKPISTFADIFRIRRLHKDPTLLYSDCDNFAISDKFPNTNWWFQHLPWNDDDEINFISGSLIKFDENDPIHMMILDSLYEMTLEDRDWNDKSVHPFINREMSRLIRKEYKLIKSNEDFPAPMRACPGLNQVYLWYDVPVDELPVLDRNLLIAIGSNGWVFESHLTWIRDNLCPNSLTQQSASRFIMSQ